MATEKARTVFAIPEALESILVQLPLQDLLVNAQRVSRTWRHLISTSPAIQRALFFQERDESSSTEAFFNPLLKHRFPPFFVNGKTAPAERSMPAIDFVLLDWNTCIAKREAYAREHASWRRMLPMQSTIRRLEVVKNTSRMGGSSRIEGEAYFEDGVRMGALYDLAQSETKRPITRVAIKWVTRVGDGEGQDEWAGNHSSETNSDRVVVIINFTQQCRRGMGDCLGPEFKSLGYEDVDIKWRKV